MKIERVKDEKYNLFNADGDRVGEVILHGTTDIAYVEIDEQYRGNSYGLDGLDAVISDIKDRNESGIIQMSYPLDDALEPILWRHNFEKQEVAADFVYKATI